MSATMSGVTRIVMGTVFTPTSGRRRLGVGPGFPEAHIDRERHRVSAIGEREREIPLDQGSNPLRLVRHSCEQDSIVDLRNQVHIRG